MVPAERTRASRPCSSRRCWSSTAPIGERHAFPVHTTRTSIASLRTITGAGVYERGSDDRADGGCARRRAGRVGGGPSRRRDARRLGRRRREDRATGGRPGPRSSRMLGGDLPFNPPFELDNRGKRSIVIDLAGDGRARVALELIDRADVFVTNVARRPRAARSRPRAARRAQPAPRLRARSPGTGSTAPTPTAPRTTSARSGPAPGSSGCSPRPVATPPFQRGGMGDHGAGMSLAAGIGAALFARERTGQGPAGLDVAAAARRSTRSGFDLNTALRFGDPASARRRTRRWATR